MMPHSEPSQTSSFEEEDEVLPDAPVQLPQISAPSPSSPPIKPDPDRKPEHTKLEDLFADMDDSNDSDDEFGSSAPAQIKTEDGIAPAVTASNPASSPEIMRSFYQRLFPFRYHFQWLNHAITPTPDYAHREFAFTLQNDAYLRYQAFPTAHVLRKEILRLLPSRFEIGPVYTTNPRDRKTLLKQSSFRPVSKELVFDIDLTDYDPIRTCCSAANICLKCWEFIVMAIKVVHAALTEDFGFQHILWVYSGRRGAHAWICDRRARVMTDAQRRAIAGYLEIIRGGDKSGKKVNVKRPLHPHISRSLTLLAPHFSTLLSTQDPFLNADQHATLLTLLTSSHSSLSALSSALAKKWDASPLRPSLQKWADIDTVAKTLKNLDTKALLEAKQDIVLEYTYPRLDVEVSKKLNHLLKSPFVVHPGTGRVCVPIPVRADGDGCDGGEGFDPLGVPRVGELLGEIDRWDGGGDREGRKVQDWEKTSLRPFVGWFRDFVAGLLRAEGGGSASATAVGEGGVVVKREVLDDEAGVGAADAMEF